MYWFPSYPEELQKSSLRMSRTLNLYASECVTMEIADARSPSGVKFAAHAKLPVVVMATPDGAVLGKAESSKGFLHVEQVEKLVDDEMKQRQNAIDEKMKDAKSKAKAGDKDGAIQEYRSVLEQKCLFAKEAKDAAKELKKPVSPTSAKFWISRISHRISIRGSALKWYGPCAVESLPKCAGIIRRQSDSIPKRIGWTPPIQRPFAILASYIATKRASGTKRVKCSMRFLRCQPIRFVAPSRSMDWGKSRSMRAILRRASS